MIDQQLQAKIIAVATQEPKTIEQQFLKLMEEAVAAAQAYLAANHASGNDYKNLDLVDTNEELTDILLVTVAMLVKLDCQPEELETLLKKKVKKWLEHQVH